jgi:hypothetical protein
MKDLDGNGVTGTYSPIIISRKVEKQLSSVTMETVIITVHTSMTDVAHYILCGHCQHDPVCAIRRGYF